MAPSEAVEATIALSHVAGVSDSARARELYKYYQPTAPINSDTCFPDPNAQRHAPADEDSPVREFNVKSNVTSSKVSSPDTALTAFCQLTSWRTGAQRAMISVIDAETQYFIAESTKTVDLVDANKYDPGDEIWMGCSSVSKAGRLCERTIEVKPTTDSDYPCFIVNDLTKDDRFDTLAFVTGPPHIRFYAGVPLITKRGIPIGSLFIVDDRVGSGFSHEKIHFMGTMARTIMRHMEMVREVEEHRRGMKMSRGLASFVEGRSELVEAEADADDNEGSKVAGQFEEPAISKTRSKTSTLSSDPPTSRPSSKSIDRKEKAYSAALAKKEEEIFEKSTEQLQRPDLEATSTHTSYDTTSADVPSPRDVHSDKIASTPDDPSEATVMKVLFSRAANLIREAFEVDGGAVFFDAQTGFSSEISTKNQYPTEKPTLDDDSYASSLAEVSHGEDYLSSGENERLLEERTASNSASPRDDSPGLGEGRFSRMTSDMSKVVQILGFSTAEASSIHGDALPGPQSFQPFPERALVTLLRRYPRGKLWIFDSDGGVSSSSEEDYHKPLSKDPFERDKDKRRRRMRTAKAKSDAKFLSRHFPGVRQLLFVPLWDAGRSRWLSACFSWSTEPTRILSKQSELAFLTAFGNSVMAEWSRIDTEIADQKKGDFIGSISHELRSPLHGILASAEFLEEVTSGWEKQLVETIDSCGRTLLDTINHILDFSKINHFEKNWRKSKRHGHRPSTSTTGPLALKSSDLPMLSLFQDVDISVICEEVVESVFAGHVFQNITAQSFDMVPDARGKMSDNRKSISSSENMMGPQQLQHAGVAVILDISSQNYQFITQPGALRRLIMNLLGNALKYTSHGYVRIKLEATEIDDLQPLKSSGSSDSVPRSKVTLTVADTGKGISADFLRSKLFMPFAQENSLSSGTGLGLSIVRKIVSLLEGEITIDSEVGRGTQVQVTLPLLREMPKTASTGSDVSSAPMSASSIPREIDTTITNLRARVTGQKVSLHGFDTDTKDPVLRESNRVLKASITTFLVNWYGLRIVPIGQRSHIIVTNEANPEMLLKLVHQVSNTNHKSHPSVIVLCSHTSRFDRVLSTKESSCNLGFVAKPVGPLKLARAITACLEGAPAIMTPALEGPSAESTDLTAVFEELSFSPRGGELLDNTRMAVDSDNARKAIESPTPNAAIEKNAEFPFPASPSKSPATNADTLSPPTKLTISPAPPTLILPAKSGLSSPKLTKAEPKPKLKTPTLLLVDDNHINIRLLSTYLNRRNYEVIHEAQNGLEAVQAVEARQKEGLQGYDIIFMDITMPILDGFGATREIRKLEQAYRKKLLESSPASSTLLTTRDGQESRESDGRGKEGACIIAFTGRSSIEDQNEAARVGVDLFMTKPVAFKEVGKIVDNWVIATVRAER